MITYRITVEDTGKFDKKFSSFMEHVQNAMKKTVQDACIQYEKQVRMNISLKPLETLGRGY